MAVNSIMDLLDTIKRQQVEIEKLKLEAHNDGLYSGRVSRLVEANKQFQQEISKLQEQVARMRAALIRVSETENRDYLKEALSDIPTDYHNPADVEEIEQLNKQVVASELMIKEYCRNIVDYLAALANAKHVLSGAEWIDDHNGSRGQHCIFCSGTPQTGHSNYCKLKKAMDAIGDGKK